MILVTPDLQSQIDFEHLYNKNQVMPRLAGEFGVPEVVEHAEKHGLPGSFAIKLMSQMVLQKRATVDVLVGILYREFEDEEDPFQACADALLKAAEIDLVDYEEVWKTNFSTMQRECHPTFILRIDVSDDVYEDMARYQYPLPLLIPPLKIENNLDSGYYTFKTSVILKHNHTEDDVYLAHLNRVNSIQFSMNPDVVALIQNKWKKLDKQQAGETFQEYQKRLKAFEKYDRDSRDVLEHLFMAGNCFYITNRYDKRGRSYAQGYHVNPQGNSWAKAVLQFAVKEVVQCPPKSSNSMNSETTTEEKAPQTAPLESS